MGHTQATVVASPTSFKTRRVLSRHIARQWITTVALGTGGTDIDAPMPNMTDGEPGSSVIFGTWAPTVSSRGTILGYILTGYWSDQYPRNLGHLMVSGYRPTSPMACGEGLKDTTKYTSCAVLQLCLCLCNEKDY